MRAPGALLVVFVPALGLGAGEVPSRAEYGAGAKADFAHGGSLGRLGGMLRVDSREGSPRFDVDLGAAEQAGFRVSPRLLRLAREVRGLEERGAR